MKNKLLAAVASFAFVATGVAAQAQENPKDKERPAAGKIEHKAPEAPKAAEKEHSEAPKAAEKEHKEAPKAADKEHKEAPKAAEKEHKEAPKAAEKEHKEAPKAAEKEHKEAPKAAGKEHKEAPKAAEKEHKEAPKAAQSEDRKDSKPGPEKSDKRAAEPAKEKPPTRTGAKEGDKNPPRTAEHPEKAEHFRVTGKVKISNQHATRVGEALHRDAHPVDAGVEIRVGVRVPDRVEIRPLPEDVITLVPEYRGYSYFIDTDDEIVFVSPETHEIVGSMDYDNRGGPDQVAHVRPARPCPTED